MNSLERYNYVAAFVYLQIICWGLTVLSAREWQFVYLLLLIPTNIGAFIFRKKIKSLKYLRLSLALAPIFVLFLSSVLSRWMFFK